MTSPDLSHDDQLLAALTAALDAADPVTPAAHDAAVAAFDVGHLEGELAELISDTSLDPPLVGVRHDGVSDRAVTFAASGTEIDLELPADQPLIVGQLDPVGPTEIVVEYVVPGAAARERQVLPVDELGRFQGELGRGSLRLHLVTESGPVVTPWILR